MDVGLEIVHRVFCTWYFLLACLWPTDKRGQHFLMNIDSSLIICNFYKVANGPLGLIGQMDPICREQPHKPAQSPSLQSGSGEGEEWEMHEI